MRKKIFTLMMTLLTVSSFALITYEFNAREIGDDYVLKFSTRSTDGSFSGLEGEVIFNPAELQNALIDVSIDASTINTGNKKKDQHANSPDWLDTDKFPKILFKSKSFKQENDKILVTGQLTLHGVENEVSVPFSYSDSNGAFTGSFIVNRSDYGITGVGLKAKFVGEEIEITFNIPTKPKTR